MIKILQNGTRSKQRLQDAKHTNSVKKHRKDVHSQHRCLVPRDGSSQTAPHLVLGTSVSSAIHLDLGNFRLKTASDLATRHTETVKPDGSC